MENNNNNKEIKQVKQTTYEYQIEKMETVIKLLNSLNITGVNQANILCQIFNIVANPINVGKNEESK
jgi:hypothetical protein